MRDSSTGLVVVDSLGKLLAATPGTELIFGSPVTEFATGPSGLVPHSLTREHGTPFFVLGRADELPDGFNSLRDHYVAVRLGSGENAWFGVEISPLETVDGATNFLCWDIENVAQPLRRTDLIPEQPKGDFVADAGRAWSAIVDSSSDAVFSESREGTIRSWSPGAQALFGYDTEEAIGKSVAMLGLSETGPGSAPVREAVLGGQTVQRRERLPRQTSEGLADIAFTISPICQLNNIVGSALVVGRDVSDRCDLERAIVHQAHHDVVTGLPNRIELVNRLGPLVAECVRREVPVAVLVVDVDLFHTVNEASGQSAGDALLAEVAARLRRLVRPSDILARLGSDEFLLVREDTAADEAEQVAARVSAAFGSPFDVAGRRTFLSASIGIAVAPPLPADADALLCHAEEATREAKSLGRSSHRMFDPSSVKRKADQSELANELREALANESLELQFQPLIELSTGSTVGIDSSVCWHHPVRGWVPRDFVLTFAEGLGLSCALDRWVLDQVFRDTARLRAWGALAKGNQLLIATSARSATDPELATFMREAAVANRLPLDALQIEIEIMDIGSRQDPARMRRAFNAMSELGIGVILSARGSSVLDYIRHPAVTTVKLPHLFVDRLTEDSRDVAVAAGIVRMARELGLGTVAQGVDTVAQLSLLRKMGCTTGEGELWSAPLPLAKIAELLKRKPAGFGLGGPPTQLGEGLRVTNEHGLHLLLRLYREGASTTTVAAALNAEGFLTPTNLRWHTNSVAKVIAELAAES